MPQPIRVDACSESQWQQALSLIASVFVGEGFVSTERNSRGCRRDVIEPAATLLTATEEGVPDRVLGVVVLPIPGSPLCLMAREGEAEMRMLAVDPQGRGRGVGASLVRECMARAVLPPVSARRMVLWTQPTMRAAQRLYERMGFERMPERDTVLAAGSEGSAGAVTRQRLAYGLNLAGARGSGGHEG
jgi:ribosomal protein S18 acetylase RimI-like enzyme